MVSLDNLLRDYEQLSYQFNQNLSIMFYKVKGWFMQECQHSWLCYVKISIKTYQVTSQKWKINSC